MEIRPIYQNFDTLEVSFQCKVPIPILARLAEAKAEAKMARNPAYAQIGKQRLPIMVHETGAKGGYTYQFSTGPDGEIWLIADRDNEEMWNVRVKVRSLGLALNGYQKTKQKILKILLEDLGAIGPESNDKIPLERISRMDYCVDFLISERFNPHYKNFVCHGRTKKSEIGQLCPQLEAMGEYVNYIRIGKMPNRQVVIYNKIQEISASAKIYWWKLWGLDKSKINGEIWRVEIRAGKKELNKWNLRTFKDFEKMAGDVVIQTLNDYQYTNPSLNDTNRTRWPMAEIWKKTISTCKKDLFEYICNAERKEILRDMKDAIIERYEKLISGILVGYTAATGKNISQIPGVLGLICDQLNEEIEKNPQKFVQKYRRKAEKFSFYKEENKNPENN